ncbi:MAG: hypothetical protein L6R35_000232 [Caloplaca aegaea]|nr:MAG: hypothetical protein L6R35_000232 [Caloplaca aegaea]
MVGINRYTVRPQPPKADGKNLLRVNLSLNALQHHRLRAGDVCQLSLASHSSFLATVWPATEKIQDNIIQITKAFQGKSGLKFGDQVSLARTTQTMLVAKHVILSEVQNSNTDSSLPSLDEANRLPWALILKDQIKRASHICPGITLSDVRSDDEKRTFRVVTVNESQAELIYESSSLESVAISTETGQRSGIYDKDLIGPCKLDDSLVGGLENQIAELNRVIAQYGPEAEKGRLNESHKLRPGGVVLHGPRGTGKSMILRMVAQAGWREVFQIQRVAKDVAKVFEDAFRLQPSVIIIDDLDTFAGRNDDSDYSQDSLLYSLQRAFNRRQHDHSECRVFVLAATSNLMLVNEVHRAFFMSDQEIEIPVPAMAGRAEILHLTLGYPKNAGIPKILKLASRTHGYVGKDLDRLCQVMMNEAVERRRALKEVLGCGQDANVNRKSISFDEGVIEEDIVAAQYRIRPTAMKEIFLETPKVRWSDIGGQDKAKEALREAVEWPLKYRAKMDRFGVKPTKGILLYGPPGCSKTLIAQAAATESQLNFIVVKGADLLSKYVGESERHVRETFQKARAARPSIIFFDEIDAIAASRGEHGPGGVHTLTTLLNEMDGVVPLTEVFILAATNRPNELDPALVRPGRFDACIYVDLPDYEARLEILNIATRKTYLATDVEFVPLAQKTGGYSGAELVDICRRAGRAALKEQLHSDEEDGISMRHFEEAIGETPKNVTEVMIDRYRNWARKGLQ